MPLRVIANGAGCARLIIDQPSLLASSIRVAAKTISSIVTESAAITKHYWQGHSVIDAIIAELCLRPINADLQGFIVGMIRASVDVSRITIASAVVTIVIDRCKSSCCIHVVARLRYPGEIVSPFERPATIDFELKIDLLGSWCCSLQCSFCQLGVAAARHQGQDLRSGPWSQQFVQHFTSWLIKRLRMVSLSGLRGHCQKGLGQVRRLLARRW